MGAMVVVLGGVGPKAGARGSGPDGVGVPCSPPLPHRDSIRSGACKSVTLSTLARWRDGGRKGLSLPLCVSPSMCRLRAPALGYITGGNSSSFCLKPATLSPQLNALPKGPCGLDHTKWVLQVKPRARLQVLGRDEMLVRMRPRWQSPHGRCEHVVEGVVREDRVIFNVVRVAGHQEVRHGGRRLAGYQKHHPAVRVAYGRSEAQQEAILLNVAVVEVSSGHGPHPRWLGEGGLRRAGA